MRRTQRGITVMLVLAYMGVFLIILGTLSSYALMQATYGRALYAREQALHIAEAGLEYYRWFLAHFPGDTTNGTGSPGPYTRVVSDPEGAGIGEFSLTVTPAVACGVTQWIDITSKGTSNADVRFPRTLSARYMQPSVANYAFILNSNVWQVSNVVGPYHANGGIRMDGTSNSKVTSAQSTWTCDGTYGCSPTQSKPGIWGVGNAELWQYPVPQVDFPSMAVNFTTLQGYASASGLYLAPTLTRLAGVQQGGTYTSVGANDQRGYHLVFNANGTVSVYRVTGTSGTQGKHIDNMGVWVTDYYTITSQTLVGVYTLPAGCSFIYSQARTWIDGTVSGKITVVAADTGSYSPDVILNGNISYATTDGTTGLTVLAEHSILYGVQIPTNMAVRGIFIAQTGYYGRNFYSCLADPYDQRASLSVQGTVVSFLRPVTRWGYNSYWYGCSDGGSSNDWSGFETRTTNYDQMLAFAPPPFTPAANSAYTFVLWSEQ